ncbi:MAG: dihydroorotate dehydrogenase electron transfer subunit [Planctomycetota bacterium]|jgi:dihydroorotate dehydrogenase electron transfer subunit
MSATCNARTARPEASMVSAVAHVTTNERISGGCHRIVAEVQGAWPESGPGQFAMLSLDHPRFPILPRPFSLLGWQRRGDLDELEWMVMPVGVGTGLLCSMQPGDALDVVGPLGHRMDIDLPDGPIVCVGGGYGIAPFLFLLESWRRQADPRVDRTTVVFGARTEERLSLVDRLGETGGRVELCTDDGSRGFAGRVDARLAEILEEQPCGMVLTCGPDAMMEAVGRVCRKAGVPARASLETVMGCGYAVCNGCAVSVSDETQPGGYTYELACREGTVFDETRLLWHQP